MREREREDKEEGRKFKKEIERDSEADNKEESVCGKGRGVEVRKA